MSQSKSEVPCLRASATIVALFSILGATTSSAQFQEPLAELVADLETTGEPLLIPGVIMGSFYEVWGSAPSQLFVFGEELVFAADDRLHGSELWITNGTTEGTRMVADICGGRCGSSPYLLGELGGELFFAAFREETGFELWATDGTAGGTRLVAEICPGSCNGFPWAYWMGSFNPTRSAVLGSELYFAGYDEIFGEELWATDGSASGTRHVADLCQGICRGAPRSFIDYGEEVWFTASEQRGERGVWKVTAMEDPQRVPDICGSRWLNAQEPLVHFGRLYWLGSCHGESLSLKRSHLFVEQSGELVSLGRLPLDSRGYPGITHSLVPAGNRLFFVNSPFDYRASDEIWVSGGAGGQPLRKVDVTFPSGTDIGPLTVLGERVFFFAGARSESTIWRSDGSEAGTIRLGHLEPLYSYRAKVFSAAGKRVFFAARDASGREGLWASSGDPVNTLFVQAIAPGSEIGDSGEAVDLGSRTIFPAIEDPEQGAELWSLDNDRLLGDRCFGPTDTILCLRERRFQVAVEWQDSHAGSGAGHALPESDGSGLFWFFDEENIELAVKVLDGTAINGHHWVGYGALTDVGYTVEVVDRLTGERATYSSREGEYCGWIDVQALPGPGSATALFSRPDLAAQTASQSVGTCEASEETLCLRDGRFALTVDWSRAAGTGVGKASHTSDESGGFWFFTDDNLELLVKVLDGRSINDRFWVFYGALSDVEYWLRVEDTLTGEIREYHNPKGTLCGGNDINAF